MAHRNHFIRLYQHNKSSASKVKIRLASNCLEGILEIVKLAHTNKTKESIASQKLGFYDFGKLVIVFLTKVNLQYVLYLTDRRNFLLLLIKRLLS